MNELDIVPPTPTLWLVGLSVSVQPGCCVTVNCCPAIVIVPVRCDAAWFAPKFHVTGDDKPPPLGPDVMVSHWSAGGFTDAAQLHATCDRVTVMAFPVPTALPTVSPERSSPNVHVPPSRSIVNV